MARRRFVSGKTDSSKFMIIGGLTNFPVTWGGFKERWSEMSLARRTAALSAMAVVAFVVVF